VECQRRDTGLRKQLRNARGASWRERWVAYRAAKKSLRGIDRVLHDPDAGVTIIQGDGEAMATLMREHFQWSDGMRESVEITERRLAIWEEKGLWS
jgi:hypothetical protein